MSSLRIDLLCVERGAKLSIHSTTYLQVKEEEEEEEEECLKRKTLVDVC